MLVGLYGGTFNPIHRGHTHAALAVCQALGLNEVRMVLSARPGHRNQPAVSELHRWRMLELACGEHHELVPDDGEIRRPGESFTVRTLEDLHDDQPGVVACWILGQDSFATLPSWFEWRRIMTLANLVVLERPGQTAIEPPELMELCQAHEVDRLAHEHPGQIVRLSLPMLEISSTQIRADIKAGKPVDMLLAEPVWAYIRQHDLYQPSEKAI
jgi:nicotinate-nucleotide adenylyltransferase